MQFTIIAFDIEGFSRSNTAEEMNQKRQHLKCILAKAATAASISRFRDAKQTSRDTGDGVYFFFDTRDYQTVLRFLDETRRIARECDVLRFRGVVHTGDCDFTHEIFQEPSGISADEGSNVIGTGFNETARYLDSETLKSLLQRETGESFVYGISRRLYSEIANQTYARSRYFAEYR